MDVETYIRRIGYTGPLAPSAETLVALHTAHTLSVVFENLDIHLGREISLETEAIYDKIVVRGRGGYCFELNGLFAWLLESLGFSVMHLAARVLDGTVVRPRSHRVLLVTVSGHRWIADVGFGGNGLIAPIPLSADRVDEQYAERFRLIHMREHEYRLEYAIQDRWEALYRVALDPQLPVDYVYANYFHSHSPDSIFTQRRLCTRPTMEGRAVLQDRRLKVRVRSQTHTHTIETVDEYRGTLKERFGLSLSDDEAEACFAGGSALAACPRHPG